MKKIICLLSLLFLISSPAFPRTPVTDDGSTDTEAVQVPEVSTKTQNQAQHQKGGTGEGEAQKYFRKGDRKPAAESSSKDVGPEDHYLAIHLGGFLSADAYQIGATAHNSSAGRLNAGVTYRMASLGSLADWALRADFIGYTFTEGNSLQLAILPLIMFPDSGSRFPLYFGFGAGPGVFLSQISGSSYLALNYQLLAGIRFFNILESTGFFLETGMKNHFLLLSPGQFNGYFLTVGAVFTF